MVKATEMLPGSYAREAATLAAAEDLDLNDQKALPDLRAERLLTTGDLRCRVVHKPFRRLQTAHAHAVAPALAGGDARCS